MAKRVFFSFHYKDVSDFRANVVRQHWVTKPDRGAAGFFDASIWESAKTTGIQAVKRLINRELKGTSVTCVLIGSETYSRPWVRYEILRSVYCGNKILGVHINAIADKNRRTKANGPNPFSYLGYKFSDDGKTLSLYEGKGGKWVKYARHQPYSLEKAAPRAKWGKFVKLSDLYPVRDWVKGKGYNNFTTWVA